MVYTQFVGMFMIYPMLCRFLSTWYGMSLGCGWRIRPPDMEGSYGCTE